MDKLPRSFYQQDALAAAQALLGKVLVRRTPEGITRARIVETEAYLGPADAAAHSYQNRQPNRTRIQYGPGGYAYVFLIYGMHWCMNVVVNDPQHPEVVLLRALEPLEGLELMQARRGRKDNLCNGPGKLCAAMAIDRSCYGMDLCGEALWLEEGSLRPEEHILATPRINVDYAGEAAAYPWRFVIQDSPWLSVKHPLRGKGVSKNSQKSRQTP